MKKISLLIVILIVTIFCIGSPAFGAGGGQPNIGIKVVSASKGITVKKIEERPIEYPLEKVVPLLVAPKEVKNIVLREGEWRELSFRIFSPDFAETTVNLIVLEGGQPTTMVRLLTPKVPITKESNFKAYPRIIVLQPEGGVRRKAHLTVQFVSEDTVLATADIYVSIPLPNKYISTNVSRGECGGGTDSYTNLNIGTGISMENTSIGVGWRKDIEDETDIGTWYFNVRYHWK